MSKVGPQLKQAREAQQKTRADVARETGILIHDLAALEYGSYDDLADDRTAAGLVKAYAEYLGFRPDEPVAEFWAERGVDPPPPLDEPAPPAATAVDTPVPDATAALPDVAASDTRALPWGWILGGAALVVLVIVAFAMRGDSQPPPAATEPAAPAEAAGPETRPAPDPTPPPPREEPASRPAPQAEPAPAPREPVAAGPASRLRVTEHGVGTGVENRRLVGESDRFRPGRRVWFWTRVRDGRAGDAIRHVWIRDGREIANVKLAVGSANWRTQSAKTLVESSIGRWVVEARDASGRVLARDEFVCEP